MPYKRERSPYYYIRRRTLKGYGDSGRLSTGTTKKKLAQDMERLLEELAERALLNSSWNDLLNAVCRERTVDLATLLKARNAGQLEKLKRSLSDPLLSEALTQFESATSPKRQTQAGLKMLRQYMHPGMRLSELTARTITDLCVQAEAPDPKTGKARKRNSVRRMMLRAISLLLRFHVGRAERDRIFADVQYAGEDDTREVHLMPGEIGELLGQCYAAGYEELAVLIRMAMQTSADRGVLLQGESSDGPKRGLLVRDLRIYEDNTDGTYSGEAYLADSKTEDRTRTVPLTDDLCRELLVLSHGKGLDDPVFNLKYQALDHPWQEVRKAAGLEHVRFKDLRAQFSIYGEEAEIPLTVLSKSMGHGNEIMTRRYQQRKATLTVSQAEAIERAMLAAANQQTEGARKTA